MSDAIKNIVGSLGGAGSTPGAAPSTGGNILSLLTKILPLASFGMGTYGNIKSGQAQQGNLDTLLAAQKKWAAMSPQQVSQMVMGATQPLNQGLVQGVGNQVNAMMGERGLSQAPGIMAGTLAQALAPAERANQDAAMQIVMQQMGLPMAYADSIGKAIPPGQSMTPALMMFLQSMGVGKPTGGSSGGGGIPIPQPVPTSTNGGPVSDPFGFAAQPPSMDGDMTTWGAGVR